MSNLPSHRRWPWRGNRSCHQREAAPAPSSAPLSTDGESSRPSLLWYLNADLAPIDDATGSRRTACFLWRDLQAPTFLSPDGFTCEQVGVAAGAMEWKRWHCERE